MVAFYSPTDRELYKQFQYLPQEQYRLNLGANTNMPNMLDISGEKVPTGILQVMPKTIAPYPYPEGDGKGPDDNDEETTTGTGKFNFLNALGFLVNPLGTLATKAAQNYFGKTTAFGNTFGFGAKGKDRFGKSVNVGDVEIDMPPSIMPTNLNDYSGGGSGHAGGQAAADAAASQASDDAAAGAGGYDDGGRVKYFYGGIVSL